MATDTVTVLANSLAKTAVEEKELSYKGLSKKWDDADSVADVVKAIETFDGLQALRLEGNTIGVEATKAIAKALETKSEMKNALGDALILAGARLTVLDLSDNAFGPDGVKGIETLLKSPTCYALEELRLNNCGMGIGGGKILAAALTHCHELSSKDGAPFSLKVFVAGRNRLENEGATALAHAFQLIGSLEEIHMPQNGINHAGVTALATALQHNDGLRIINLNDNTFTEKGAVAMAQALKHLRSVQVINFGDCLLRSAGASAIAESVSGGLPILKELNLSFGEITGEAALTVARAIKGKNQLERLDLNGNCLGDDGCKALKDCLENLNMGDVLGSLSDDEGDQEDDEDDEGGEGEEEEEEEEDGDEDLDEEEIDEEEEEEDDDDDDEEGEPEKSGTKFSTPAQASRPPDVSSFLSFPSPDKLLKLGASRASLIQQQVDVSDSTKTAEAFLKIASVYKENNEVKAAVLDSVDALLRKAFATPSFQGYNFVSSLLVLLGLIKSEDKVKPVVAVPGHLQALEHVVRQDYFPKENVAVLQAFMSRNSKTLESCGNARSSLQSTLQRVRPEG